MHTCKDIPRYCATQQSILDQCNLYLQRGEQNVWKYAHVMIQENIEQNHTQTCLLEKEGSFAISNQKFYHCIMSLDMKNI